MKKNEDMQPARGHCIVCGRETEKGGLCDRCLESLSLCDVDTYVARKRAAEICSTARANAFK